MDIRPVSDLQRFAAADRHESLTLFEEKISGLRAYIAIHSTARGPATGGTRLRQYESDEAAIEDVLNLSKAMSYKCALAEVPFGGGKGVIMSGSSHLKTEALLEAYGLAVNSLGGKFTTGTDAGITEEDTAVMARRSAWILGQNINKNDKADTSEMAALGVFESLRPCLREIFGEENFEKRTFSIKGLGKIGAHLVKLLYPTGAVIYASDIDADKIRSSLAHYPRVKTAKASEIHALPVDVYMPCAYGAEFTPENVKELRCKAVVGGANNQLISERAGLAIHNAGILYAPDYVVNAGGLINIVDELMDGGYNIDRVRAGIENIKKSVARIIDQSKIKNKAPFIIANEMAEMAIYGSRPQGSY